MPCCGNLRKQGMDRQAPYLKPTRVREDSGGVYFKYIGKTGMIVIGPYTGFHYQFLYAGAVVPVDQRDYEALTRVPHLIEI